MSEHKDEPSGFSRFLGELKRRHVVRFSIGYAAVAEQAVVELAVPGNHFIVRHPFWYNVRLEFRVVRTERAGDEPVFSFEPFVEGRFGSGRQKPYHG